MLTDEDLSTLEIAHKRVQRVLGKNGVWEVVYRKPTRIEYKRFRSMSHNPAQVADAQEALARSCCVFPPTSQAFDALLEDFPGIPEASGKTLLELAGMSAEESAKI